MTILGVVGACALAIPLFAANSSASMRTSEYSDGTPRERVAWEDGVREGLCVRWNRDGSVRASGQYLDGKMSGEWEFYLSNGELDSSESGSYDNGRLHK